MLLSKTNTVKLADLGIAKVLSDTIGRTYVGTMPYMSPELERCKDKANEEEGITYSFNTDVWLETLNSRFFFFRLAYLM